MQNSVFNLKEIRDARKRLEAKIATPEKALADLKRLGHIEGAIPIDPKKAIVFHKKQAELMAAAKDRKNSI